MNKVKIEWICKECFSINTVKVPEQNLSQVPFGKKCSNCKARNSLIRLDQLYACPFLPICKDKNEHCLDFEESNRDKFCHLYDILSSNVSMIPKMEKKISRKIDKLFKYRYKIKQLKGEHKKLRQKYYLLHGKKLRDELSNIAEKVYNLSVKAKEIDNEIHLQIRFFNVK